MSGWKPISTAPKSGSILGYMPNTKHSRPYIDVIWWDEQFETTGWDEEAGDSIYRAAWSAGRVGSWNYQEYAEEHPTHWQPLPPGPTP